MGMSDTPVHVQEPTIDRIQQAAQTYLALRTAGNISRVAASSESIAEHARETALNTQQIANGIEGLKSAFDWQIGRLIWQVEQQRETLKNITEILESPLETQARELRRRALDAYNNEWWDECLNDCVASEEKNPYDFVVQQTAGNVYLFVKKEYPKAIEFFEKAAKYAKPSSSYHASYALMHLAKAMAAMGDVAHAEKAIAEAVQLSPELAEAHFQHAEYQAFLRNTDGFIASLQIAISYDTDYILKAYSCPVLSTHKKEMDALLERITRPVRSKAEAMTASLQSLVKEFGREWEALAAPSLQRARKLYERNSYLDCRKAIEAVQSSAQKVVRALAQDISVRELQTELSGKGTELTSALRLLLAASVGFVVMAFAPVLFEEKPSSLYIGIGIGLAVISSVWYFRQKKSLSTGARLEAIQLQRMNGFRTQLVGWINDFVDDRAEREALLALLG